MPESFYHVYIRGINKSNVFKSETNKKYVQYLINRHLCREPVKSKMGYVYPHYYDDIELLAYCIMDNHLHLLIYQIKKGGVSQCMRSLLTAYVAYYNRHHDRTGPLFESRFKASHVNDDNYLLHISRYIHLNPRRWKRYKYSSIDQYRTTFNPEWLRPERILRLYRDREGYMKFLEEYEAKKAELSKLKRELREQLEA